MSTVAQRPPLWTLLLGEYYRPLDIVLALHIYVYSSASVKYLKNVTVHQTLYAILVRTVKPELYAAINLGFYTDAHQFHIATGIGARC